MALSFETPKTLGELATFAGATVKGDPSYPIAGVATLSGATSSDITFLTNAAYKPQLKSTQAGAVILSEDNLPDCPVHALVTSNPHATYAKIAGFCERTEPLTGQIHPTAVVDPSAQIDDSAQIGAHCVIGPHVQIAADVLLHPHVVVEAGVTIGRHTVVHPHVTLCHDVQIGAFVTLLANTVVGSDGFGFAFENGQWVKVPQLGRVIIHDHVDIGAHTTIDRGALEDTVIELGVKIDNQVQIGHNVVIGAHTVVAGTAAFAGSSKIGRYCLIGGGATFAGHITVCDKVQVAGMTTVTRSITKPGVYASGTGMMPAKDWRKSVVHFRHLDELNKRVKQLERDKK